MEKTLLNKNFIGEKSFNQLISPFKEVIEKKGWSLLCKHKPAGFTSVVREFFINLVGRREKAYYVKGERISFYSKEINRVFNLSELNDGSKFQKLYKDIDHQKIVELLIVEKEEWNSTKKNPFDSISRGSLTEEAKVWFYFLNSVLMPSKHLSIVRKEEALLLYAIMKGYKMNAGKIMERSIIDYNSKYNCLIPHPETITRLFILGRVEGK